MARLRAVLETQACVLVSIVEIKGSAPRALGSRMLVTREAFEGSVGGGNLEYAALEQSRLMLDAGAPAVKVEQYGLGPALRQCCGGAVSLVYEYFQPPGPAWMATVTERLAAGDSVRFVSSVDGRFQSRPADNDEVPENGLPAGSCINVDMAGDSVLLEDLRPGCFDLYLFGAGHVGQALVSVLRDQPFRVTWVDNRAGLFPEPPPRDTRCIVTDDPLSVVAAAGEDPLFLVMTHSHELDEDICHAVLGRDEFRWLGLIGSRTKGQRFRHRLAARGLPKPAVERLTCPIGQAGMTGKRPATIAIAVAAQLLAEQVPEAWK